MKNFFLAVAIALLLASGLGAAIWEWMDINIYFSDELLSPFDNLILFLALAVLFVIVGFIIAISMFGAIVIGLVAAAAALFTLGLSVFWPVLVVLAAIGVWRHYQKRASVRAYGNSPYMQE
ncbi:hypothetical protein HHX48_14225 [Salinimonas sp. HHU 13199]|uniref:Uncharacterized protein n=1 Tax=Salinimonas profundi TaxID=2729140 RepID=A0ABR8LSH6_9ALTE|nr:hypothetical protein [Salinimonas profundi]MBD3586899.1 hypothetical protein [Salinimonas profundi]